MAGGVGPGGERAAEGGGQVEAGGGRGAGETSVERDRPDLGADGGAGGDAGGVAVEEGRPSLAPPSREAVDAPGWTEGAFTLPSNPWAEAKLESDNREEGFQREQPIIDDGRKPRDRS